MRAMRTLRSTVAAALGAALCLAGVAGAGHVPGGGCANCADHKYWPTIDGLLKRAKNGLSVTFNGTSRSDELLGHHGSDVLRGRRRAD